MDACGRGRRRRSCTPISDRTSADEPGERISDQDASDKSCRILHDRDDRGAGREKRHESEALVFLKAGVCGGFTTFSSFAFETQQLAQKGEGGLAFLYVLLSVLLGVSMVFLAEKAAGV